MTYNVVRSKRKTICICVSSRNEVTVRCPLHIPDKKIDEFVASKRDWLLNVLYVNELKLSDNYNIINYKEIFVGGRRLPLILGGKDNISAEAVTLSGFKNLKKLYISAFAENFMRFFESISMQSRLFSLSVKFKSYKSRWGCCDRNGNITFNYMIFMLPENLQRYVIIHELCHTVYFNHSREFWSLVEKSEPDYKSLRNRLKCFNFITNLY